LEVDTLRYGIYSDIHGNLEALLAVLSTLEREGVDQYLCLGDVVGYGANPRECLHLVLEYGSLLVAGNHDYAIGGKLSLNYFNKFARQAVVWTQDKLSKQEKKFLATLDMVQKLEKITIVHATLHLPEMFNYIQTSYDANLSLQVLETPVGFYGHSHVPVAFFKNSNVTFCMDEEIYIGEHNKSFINVGSVGQPRDENPLACCAVYDDELEYVWLHRVEYDIDTAVGKIIRAGLPEMLGERLRYGR
jgi:predicted phosphodiesterase